MAEKIVEVDGKRYVKVQKGKYFNKKKNRKMKRHHPVRWILISAFCLLIVAPVGFIFGAFYDSSTKEVNDTTEKFTDNFTNVMAKGLTSIGESGILTIELDNDFLDSTLVIAQNELLTDPTISKFIKKIYCNVDGNNYDFILEVQLSFFKTRVHLQTYLEFDETIGESGTYVFKINNIVLGRLPLGNLAKTFLPQFLSESQIQTAVSAIFPNCKVSLANMEITYEKSKLKQDLGDILNSANLLSGSPLASVLLNLYSNISTSATFKDKITINMDFNDLKDPQIEPRNAISIDFKTNIGKHSEKVALMMNDKNLNLSVDDSGTIFNYFVTGYSENAGKIFDDEKKANITAACKTYLDISDLTTYKGDSVYINSKLESSEIGTEIVLPESISLTDLKNGINVSFSDTTLSKFIRSTPLMGYTFAMPIQVGEKYYFNYVMFDDFSMNIEEGKINLLGDINFNTVQVPITIECSVDSISGATRQLDAHIDHVYVSKFELVDTETAQPKGMMLDYLATGFTSGEIFTFDRKEEKFGFNIKAINVTGTSYDDLVNGVLQYKDSFTFKYKDESETEITITIEKEQISFTCSAIHSAEAENGSLNFHIQYTPPTP